MAIGDVPRRSWTESTRIHNEGIRKARAAEELTRLRAREAAGRQLLAALYEVAGLKTYRKVTKANGGNELIRAWSKLAALAGKKAPDAKGEKCEGCGKKRACLFTADDVHVCVRCYEVAVMAGKG